MKRVVFLFALVAVLSGAFFSVVRASRTVRFTAVINPGVLTTDIRDGEGKPVEDPTVNLDPIAYSDDCRFGGSALTGKFGDEDRRIYIENPEATEGGWSLTIAPAEGKEAKWQGVSGHIIDFDDPGIDYSGCVDTDRDGAAGLLSLDPSRARLEPDCLYCSKENLVLGPGEKANFAQSESLTLLRANQDADSIGRWYVTGIDINQSIPASQLDDTYSINLMLTAAAS